MAKDAVRQSKGAKAHRRRVHFSPDKNRTYHFAIMDESASKSVIVTPNASRDEAPRLREIPPFDLAAQQQLPLVPPIQDLPPVPTAWKGHQQPLKPRPLFDNFSYYAAAAVGATGRSQEDAFGWNEVCSPMARMKAILKLRLHQQNIRKAQVRQQKQKRQEQQQKEQQQQQQQNHHHQQQQQQQQQQQHKEQQQQQEQVRQRAKVSRVNEDQARSFQVSRGMQTDPVLALETESIVLYEV